MCQADSGGTHTHQTSEPTAHRSATTTLMLWGSCLGLMLWGLWRQASVDWTWSKTFRGCSIGSRSGEFGGRVGTLSCWSCSLSYSWMVWALWAGYSALPGGLCTAMRECCCHEGCTWSVAVFRWVVHVKVISLWKSRLKFSQQNVADDPLTCQWL